MKIALKRAYEPVEKTDGARVLVDRLWPRGLTKEVLGLHTWLKEVAPSTELRKWYHARPSMWESFRKKYLLELREGKAEAALEQLYEIARAEKKTTLLFASKNEDQNHAVVLKALLEGMRKPPASTGPAKEAAGAGRKRAAARR